MRMIPRLAPLTLVLLLAGCQSYVLEPVDTTIGWTYSRTLTLPPPAADILFVIDDSASMAGEQANLARSFAAFVDVLETENRARDRADLEPVHYRIAVTSTSVDQRYGASDGSVQESDRYTIASGRDCQTTHELRDGDLYPQGDFLAAPGNAALLDSETPGLTTTELLRQLEENVQLGVCGSGQEQGLRAAELALHKHPDFGRHAKLVVVFLSDEEDCSDPTGAVVVQAPPVDACVAEATLPGAGALASVTQLADFLGDRSPEVVVGVIASATGSCLDPGCEADCPGAGDPTGSPCWCGGQSAGSRYLQLADLIGGDSRDDSICQADFSATLRSLAEAVVEVEWIDLPERPMGDDPSFVLLTITRDGEDIRCGSPTASRESDPSQTCANDLGLDWEYDAASNAIRLCGHPGSACQIESGDRYRVSLLGGVCTVDRPC